jgi:hypothetical protein
MNEYHIYLLWCVFLGTLVIIDQRKFFCRRATLWSWTIIIVGVILLLTGILINCYLAYYSEGITQLRYDPHTMLDTILLRMNQKNKYLFFWRTATFGIFFIISGVEVLIICKLNLRKNLDKNDYIKKNG